MHALQQYYGYKLVVSLCNCKQRVLPVQTGNLLSQSQTTVMKQPSPWLKKW